MVWTSVGCPTSPLQHSVFLRKVWQFDFDPAAPKPTSTATTATAARAPATSMACPSSITTASMWPAAATSGGARTRPGSSASTRRAGDITTNGPVWSYPLQKHVLSTPAIDNGLVFIADCGRAFHCVDAETGQPCWTHEIKGEAWASPLVADGKVYLGTRSGTFYVFAASREKEVLSTIDLGHPIVDRHRRQRRALRRHNDPPATFRACHSQHSSTPTFRCSVCSWRSCRSSCWHHQRHLERHRCSIASTARVRNAFFRQWSQSHRAGSPDPALSLRLSGGALASTPAYGMGMAGIVFGHCTAQPLAG